MPTTPVSQDTFRFEIENFEGLSTALHPSKIEMERFLRFENFSLKVDGHLGFPRTRNGYNQYNTNAVDTGNPIVNLFEHKSKSANYLIAKSLNSTSSVLAYLSDYALDAPSSISSSEYANKYNFASFKDDLIVVNRNDGADYNYIWDTSNYEQQGAVPANMISSLVAGTSAGGGVNDGLHNYIVRFIYENGDRSGIVGATGITATTGAGNNTVTLTLPTAPHSTTNSRIIGREIWRTKETGANNALTYYYLAKIDNNTQTAYTDSASDDSLGSEGIGIGEFYNSMKPPKAKYVTTHKNRVVLANLKDPLVDAPASGDFSLVASTGAGSLDTGAVYKYRIRKVYFAAVPIDGPIVLKHSNYTEYTVNTGVGNQVTISYTGSDSWFGHIYIERTEGGGSTFYPLLTNLVNPIHPVKTNYLDQQSDATLVAATSRPRVSQTYEPTLSNEIAISEPNSADKFNGDKYFKVDSGMDGSAPITQVVSEDNRIVVFKDNSIHKIVTSQLSSDYWYPELIVDGIGATWVVKLPRQDYLLISSTTTPSDRMLVYYWDGAGDPVPCDKDIFTYLDGKGHTIQEAFYDKSNNQVVIVTIDNTALTQIFRYDLDLIINGLGTWFIDQNTDTDLNLSSGAFFQSKGAIFGAGDGYLYYQNPTSYVDNYGGSDVPFVSVIETKRFAYEDADLVAKKLLATIEGQNENDPNLFLKYSLDYGSLVTALTYQMVEGENRPKKPINAQGKNISYTLEHTPVDSKPITIFKMGIELERRHKKFGGNV